MSGSERTVPEVPEAEKEEYDSLLGDVNAIAAPLAPRKLAKKLYKLVRKASKQKKRMLRGTAEIQRGFRKGATNGLVVLAGNVSPMDIYSHMPALCEEKDVPYVFTPSKVRLCLSFLHHAALESSVGGHEPTSPP